MMISLMVICSMAVVAGQFHHAAVGFSPALAWTVAGVRAIAFVPARMEQHGNSRDGDFIRTRQEREHLAVQPQKKPPLALLPAAGVSEHLPGIRKFVARVEETPAFTRKMQALTAYPSRGGIGSSNQRPSSSRASTGTRSSDPDKMKTSDSSESE
jgi:hypothetical protein